MTSSLPKKRLTTARRSFAWQAATSRSGRRLLSLVAGLCAASAMFAQTPYQPVNHAAEATSAPVAVQAQNSTVPTYTFRRPEAASNSAAPPTVYFGQRVQPKVAEHQAAPQQVAAPVTAAPVVMAQPTMSPIMVQDFAPVVMAQPTMAPIMIQEVSTPTPETPPVVTFVAQSLPMAEPMAPAPVQNQVMVIPAPRVFVPVVFQAPPPPPTGGNVQQPPSGSSDENMTLRDLGIEVNPPTGERLFRLDTEIQLKKRVASEIQSRPSVGTTEKVEFPIYHALSDKSFEPRVFGGVIKQIEPNYVLYNRLYGEELNSERYGWELGPIQPIVSTLYAWGDMATLPYNFAARPCQRFETSAGRCYPGDPVPYLIYPMVLSATGAGWEAAIIVAAFAVIP